MSTPTDRSVLARVRTPRGELVLARVGEHLEIVSNGVFLMDTRDGRSERLLARAALDRHPAPRRVLVGGLGVGFTLAEVLTDRRVAAVTVVEIEPAVVDWQRSALAAVAGHPLDDPRVRVVVGDLADHLTDTPEEYDLLCLDVDNGPDWTVTEDNGRLYSPAGTGLLRDRMGPGGVLAVWSSRAVPAYRDALGAVFDEVTVLTVPVARGEPDVVYLAGDRPSGPGRDRPHRGRSVR